MSRSTADGATAQIIPPSRARPAEAPRQRDKSAASDHLLLTVAEAARRLGVGRSLRQELLADTHVDPSTQPAAPHTRRRTVTYIHHQRRSQLRHRGAPRPRPHPLAQPRCGGADCVAPTTVSAECTGL